HGELRQSEITAAELERAGASGTVLTVTLGSVLPIGYHRFSLWRSDEQIAVCPLIVAPRRCYVPASISDERRVWGLTAQLYAVRSERNWGIGDFSDLRALIETASTRGAALVGVNPLHALRLHEPARASPYSASSRVFLNPLYLDVAALVE